MKTKDLIQFLAIHRKLAKTADLPELREHHWRQFSDLALQVAHKQADAYDRKMRRIGRRTAQVRERLSLSPRLPIPASPAALSL